MCMATERLLLNTIPSLLSPLHSLVFGSTLVIYNAHFLLKRSTPELSDRFGWSQHYRTWHYIVFSIGFVLALGSLFWMPWKLLLGCAVLGLLSFTYSLPLLPFKNKKRLKDFGWIKIVVLTSVWTIVTSALPMLYWDKPIAAYPLEIVLRFAFMFALCVAFDIRDMQTDLEDKIFTLPNLIGVKNSYRLIAFTLLVFMALSVMQYFRYPSLVRLNGEFITAIITMLAIIYAKYYPSDRIYLGLIDGMMLFYALLVLYH